jgi:hypothetical protein
MVKLHNPALHAEPRNQEPAIIPPRKDSSLLDWLRETGRLVAREAGEHHHEEIHEEIEEEELEELIETTNTYDFEEEQEETLNIEE